MNIKRAKQEIKNTIQVYLTKNEHGEYEIPSMRQRPVLLIGPPGIGKTQIMEQVARECGIGQVLNVVANCENHRSPVYLGEDLQWEECPCDGIYYERDRRGDLQ